MLSRSQSARALLCIIAFAAAPQVAVGSVSAQCTADGPATPFGPRAAMPADSGRMYSYLLTGGGREMYFFKRVGAAPEDYRIFHATRAGTSWGQPERVNLGGDFSDLYPSLSPDGQRLAFSSYRPVPGDTSKHPNSHLWMARRTPTGWSMPELVRASRIGYYHSGLRQDSVGTLTFNLTTPDWRSAENMQLRWNGGNFETQMTPVAQSPALDYWRKQSGDSVYVWGVVSAPDARMTLVQVSRVTQPSGRRGPAQYFVTYPRGDGWTPLVPAGGGLGSGAPNFLWFSGDGCYIHYTRDYTEFMRVPVRTVMKPEH